MGARADVLLKVPALLTSPGRRAARPRDRAANPEVEIETAELQALLETKREDFALRAKKLHDAAVVVRQAIDAKDKGATSECAEWRRLGVRRAAMCATGIPTTNAPFRGRRKPAFSE
ncbi:MAG: hypothetical protein WDO18_18070 [Acidobacteriota bacterium]